jgi:hypothetical protein
MTPGVAPPGALASGARLEMLEAEARHARDRYRLYRASVSGRRATSPGRLRELEREHRRAESRLRRATSGEARLLAALTPTRGATSAPPTPHNFDRKEGSDASDDHSGSSH